MGARVKCWFAQFSNRPCDGQLIRAHLIDKQKIRQNFPNGAVRIDGRWQPWIEGLFLPDDVERDVRTTRELQEDPRSWRPACGGIVGLSGHHGMFDAYTLNVPREALPEDVEQYAALLGLTWLLDRRYGPRPKMPAEGPQGASGGKSA